MKKVKLRDMNGNHLEKILEIKVDCTDNCYSCNGCIFKAVISALDESCGYGIFNKDLYSDKFLGQEVEIENEPILTEKEINYLSAIIKPFRKKLTHLKKGGIFVGDKGLEYLLFFAKNIMVFDLPYFEKGKYYKGMEINRKYTLEELGL